MPPATSSPRRSFSLGRLLGLVALLIWFGLLGLAAFRHQAVTDWVRLYRYQPPAAIAQLAATDTMTPAAQHLFYLNRPQLETRANFSGRCNSTEQTIVVGCYHGAQQGIYILAVTDQRLDGIEPVTAAHEMLHAAYDRLSSRDKKQVDGWLQDYYHNQLQDQRIKDTIAAYQKTEPTELVNEMHSIFGTEIAVLPPQLETYYSRYFENRSAVTTLAAKYQQAFTSRRQEVARYDEQLISLKAQIEVKQADLEAKNSQLALQQNQLNSARRNGDTAGYNQRVPAYNAAVDAYNSEVDQTKQLIATYNALVEKRNAVALEEQQLVQSISGQSVTPIAQ